MSPDMRSKLVGGSVVVAVGVVAGLVFASWRGPQIDTEPVGSRQPKAIASDGSLEASETNRVDSREPITIVSHGSLELLTLEELIAGSTQIVLGRVITIYPARWNTPDGILPPDVTAETAPLELVIFADTELAIERAFKGGLEDTVRVRTFGGQVGQDRMIVDSQPSLDLGQAYVLFLVQDAGTTGAIGPDHYLVLGAVQGAYKIVGDRASSIADELPLADLLTRIGEVNP